ncbi:MAG: hypothetical protein NZ739_05735 [Verrucomicrobiae bacterium]|nr:hypothetical protein [Verrucomicrobiae bacterium]MDW7979648.1 hypothetical protein [Verrucomicrobiales bacterium]
MHLHKLVCAMACRIRRTRQRKTSEYNAQLRAFNHETEREWHGAAQAPRSAYLEYCFGGPAVQMRGGDVCAGLGCASADLPR